MPSRPVGQPLNLHGHGRRERQLRGPDAPGHAPDTLVIHARRHRCQPCGAVITVVPADVLPRRHYRAQAIALAFALFGLLRVTVAAVRAAVSTWPIVGASAARGWLTLRRWIDAAVRGALFVHAQTAPPEATLRAQAARVASWLAGHAPPSADGSLAHQACQGALHAP